MNFDFRYDFHDFLSVLNCTPALVIVGEADGEEAFHRHGQHHVDRAHQRYLQGGCEGEGKAIICGVVQQDSDLKSS